MPDTVDYYLRRALKIILLNLINLSCGVVQYLRLKFKAPLVQNRVLYNIDKLFLVQRLIILSQCQRILYGVIISFDLAL